MTSTPNRMSRPRMHVHSGSLQELLGTIETEVTAAAIMTPWAQVDFITAEVNGPEVKSQATELMNRRHYSAVPMVWANNVQGIYLRYDPDSKLNFERIKPEHFVAPDIGLLALIRRMRDTQKIVVGIGNAESPTGWITYADFSKRPFRVLLFALMAEIEYLLACALDMAHPDDSWIELLPTDETGARDIRAQLRQRQRDAAHWDSVMPLTTFAEIGDLICAVPASQKALALLGETESIVGPLKSIPDLRNRVAHVVRPVIAGPKQISSVADQIDLVLAWMQRWTASLAAEGGSGEHS